MRLKLTAIAALAALLGIAAVAAQAGPVTVAIYKFQSAGDVQAFYKVRGVQCRKAWRKRSTLGVRVGKGTKACAYRSSVVADAQDPRPDQEMSAAVNLAAATPSRIRKRIYLSVAVRQSKTASYELRVLPAARRWQLWRNPRGAAGPTLLGSGGGRFIRQGVAVRNNIRLRAFDRSTAATRVIAWVNKRRVLSLRDSESNQPDGRRTVVLVGARGKGSANRAVAAFDNVAIRVPDPFG